MGNEFYINQLKGLNNELENLKEETMNHLFQMTDDAWCNNDIRVTVNGKTFRIPFSAEIYYSLSEMTEKEISELE